VSCEERRRLYWQLKAGQQLVDQAAATYASKPSVGFELEQIVAAQAGDGRSVAV
jgi:hypothetical protein